MVCTTFMVSWAFFVQMNFSFTVKCCFFEKKNLPVSKLKSLGWGQQAEILTYLSNNSKKIYETSVNYDDRKYFEGKKIRYYHIIEVIYWIVFSKLKILFS